jgi:hypothetical protein
MGGGRGGEAAWRGGQGEGGPGGRGRGRGVAGRGGPAAGKGPIAVRGPAAAPPRSVPVDASATNAASPALPLVTVVAEEKKEDFHLRDVRPSTYQIIACFQLSAHFFYNPCVHDIRSILQFQQASSLQL